MLIDDDVWLDSVIGVGESRSSEAGDSCANIGRAARSNSRDGIDLNIA